ncbi:MAG TPA: alpha/beta fold hydrolase, partial [Stellaceae bacterium]|nr:alpha/beta fold hydrolase [Stellaceae bacterium]
MPRISIGDCELYYEREGSGFPVLFITGLAGTADFWHGQIPGFSRSYETIAYDHRGVGQSDQRCASNVIERLAADAIGLLDALRIPKAHVVGHSAGGAVAQVLAIEHPQRLASVVIVAGWTKPDAYFRRFFGLRKELLSRLGPSSYIQANTLFLYPAAYIAANNEKLRQHEAQVLAHSPSPDTIANRIDAILAFDRTADLARIRTPTLVLGAQDDLITPAYFSEELARRIPGAEAKFFPQGGHDFPHT